MARSWWSSLRDHPRQRPHDGVLQPGLAAGPAALRAVGGCGGVGAARPAARVPGGAPADRARTDGGAERPALRDAGCGPPRPDVRQAPGRGRARQGGLARAAGLAERSAAGPGPGRSGTVGAVSRSQHHPTRRDRCAQQRRPQVAGGVQQRQPERAHRGAARGLRGSARGRRCCCRRGWQRCRMVRACRRCRRWTSWCWAAIGCRGRPGRWSRRSCFGPTGCGRNRRRAGQLSHRSATA